MFEANTLYEEAIMFSRFDVDHLLASCSAHPIVLEDKNWLTAEHYVQSRLVLSERLAKEVEQAASGQDAWKMVKPWYRSKVADWKNIRGVLMTRALYTKVQMYEEVREFLLNTGEQHIVETSAYDHYWGIGRDQRGENRMGMIWMDIRKKIKNETK